MRLQGSVSWLISIPATAADDHQDDEVPLAKQLKAKARLHFIFTEKCTKNAWQPLWMFCHTQATLKL